jgi:hypothetical protein
MGFDEYGILWLADPWVAAGVLLALVGLFLWSHGWVASGRPPSPRAMAVRVRPARPEWAALRSFRRPPVAPARRIRAYQAARRERRAA